MEAKRIGIFRRKIFSCYNQTDYANRQALINVTGEKNGHLAVVLNSMADLGWLKLRKEPATHGDKEKITGAWITARGRDTWNAEKMGDLP